MRPRADIYLDIMYRGLLNTREAGWQGDAAQCAAEADHLHNLPSLLQNLELGGEQPHDFYWRCMRGGYIKQSRPEYSARYEHLWSELDAANRAAAAGRPVVRYAAVFEKAEQGYSVYVPDLPGCVSTGRVLDTARQNIQEAINLHVEGLIADDDLIPEASTRVAYVEACAE